VPTVIVEAVRVERPVVMLELPSRTRALFAAASPSVIPSIFPKSITSKTALPTIIVVAKMLLTKSKSKKFTALSAAITILLLAAENTTV
jgi:hypothetical protein